MLYGYSIKQNGYKITYLGCVRDRLMAYYERIKGVFTLKVKFIMVQLGEYL